MIAGDPGLRVPLEIVSERAKQDAKWGEQNHEDGYWLGILMEEVGEVSKEYIEAPYNDSGDSELRQELIQVAAVAVAWVEAIDRR